MRYSTLFISFFLLLNLYASDLRSKSYNKGLNIVPKPLAVILKDGSFVLNAQTQINYSSSDLKQNANLLAEKFAASTGYSIKTITQGSLPQKNMILLSIESIGSSNKEAYLLDVSEDQIKIKANNPNGVFYGMQTLLQLFPAEIEFKSPVSDHVWEIPNLTIEDEPRFKWRGVMLDICRHFFPVEFIKKQIDVLAMYKINTLHLHLTDDQGWRIEVKQYPKLTRVGAFRTEFDGTVYGGFLTQNDIKEIVSYAKERYINIVPEIELPGHAKAALAAYPELSCTGGPFQVRTHWGVEKEVYCAGKEKTFEFLEHVLDELIPLFPGEYIHIGGDECPKDRWNACPSCKKRMQDENLKDADELQSYFVKRIEKIVNKHGRKMIGWDEILDGGLAPSATVMSWRGEKGGIAAAEMDHDVVMTPGNWLYFDYYQGDRKIEPVAIGGYTPLKKVYNYEPIPSALSESKHKHILGAQANMWTEYVSKPELVEYRLYPRVLALSELTWTAKDLKNYIDFERRVHNQLVRLDQHDINYHIPQPEQPFGSCNKLVFTDSIEVVFNTSRPLTMVYTVDGSDPDQQSSVYCKALKFNQSSILKIRTLLPSGKMSNTRTIPIEKQSYLPEVKVKNPSQGLKGKRSMGKYSSPEDITNKTKWVSYDIKSFKDIEVISGAEQIPDDAFYALVLEGYIDVPEDNVYCFSTDVDQFWIGGKLLVNNENELKRFSRHDSSIALKKGFHPIKILYISNIYKGWLSSRREVDIQFKTKNTNEFKPVVESMLFK
jgi:hexosaminidase